MDDLRVLVIEDDEGLREPLVNALLLEGFEVCALRDPLEGLDCVERTAPDVVVVDLRLLPRIAGLGSLHRAVALAPLDAANSSPMLVVAAPGDAAFDGRYDVQAVLWRPFAIDDLVLEVRHHAARRSGRMRVAAAAAAPPYASS
jgi:DNA-binding response OmpR family regulator